MARISEHITVHRDGEHLVFENDRGLMINGNRRIHMANWTLNDLRDIICHITGRADCCCHVTKTDGPEEHEADCRYA